MRIFPALDFQGWSSDHHICLHLPFSALFSALFAAPVSLDAFEVVYDGNAQASNRVEDSEHHDIQC